MSCPEAYISPCYYLIHSFIHPFSLKEFTIFWKRANNEQTSVSPCVMMVE